MTPTPPTQPDRDTLARAIMDPRGARLDDPDLMDYTRADAVLALLAAGTPAETADVLRQADDGTFYYGPPTPPPAEDTDTLDRATGEPLTDAQMAARYRSDLPYLRRALEEAREDTDQLRSTLALTEAEAVRTITALRAELAQARQDTDTLRARVEALCDEAKAEGNGWFVWTDRIQEALSPPVRAEENDR